MKHLIVITGLCIACLLSCIFVAGCMSQNSGNATVQTPAPQPVITGQPATEGTSQDNADVGIVSDDAGDQIGSDQGSVTMAVDTPVAPSSNSTDQNVSSESEDFGDILP